MFSTKYLILQILDLSFFLRIVIILFLLGRDMILFLF